MVPRSCRLSPLCPSTADGFGMDFSIDITDLESRAGTWPLLLSARLEPVVSHSYVHPIPVSGAVLADFAAPNRRARRNQSRRLGSLRPLPRSRRLLVRRERTFGR